MFLFLVILPMMFLLFGVWCVYRATRSWGDAAHAPSRGLLFAGKRPRRAAFIDSCILPLGALYIGLGTALGSAGLAKLDGSIKLGSPEKIVIYVSVFDVALSLALIACMHFLRRPKALIPNYLRDSGVPRV